MFDKCVFFHLNSLTREVNKHWEEQFAPLGLSPSHGYLVKLVLENPGATQKFLAEQLNLAPSTLTRFVDALDKKGLVKRQGCCDDARAMLVHPTKKAEALRKGIEKTLSELSKDLGAKLGSKNLSELVRVLQSAQAAIQN